MTNKNSLPLLLFVVGTTASGKSDLAVEISERVARVLGPPQPEIINCDSVQFFAGVQIGAAKPSPDLLSRAPHHLIGHIPLGETYTAGGFRRDALRIIDERKISRIDTFLGVGGSGFYIQALEKGMFDVPVVASEIRAEVEKDFNDRGIEFMHAELRRRDPVTGEKIKPGDSYRILRTIEILRAAEILADQNGGLARTLSEMREQFERTQRVDAHFRSEKIGLVWSRAKLRERITLRTRTMLREGLLDEVEHFRSLGLGDWSPMQSVGYKEAQEFIEGRIPRENLEPLIITSTMQLAKRQMTWFKRDPSIRWFEAENGLSEPITFATERIQFTRIQS